VTNSPTAFISHASIDAELAQQLCAAIENGGVHCWIAPRDILPGQPWSESIVEGIEGCSAFVLLATGTSVLSRDVMIEVERAHRLDRPIYTVMVDQPHLSREITYYLTRLQWLESSEGGINQAGSRLSEVLQGTKRWEAVSTPPSLSRRIRSTLPSFAGALAAVLMGLMILGAGLWFAMHRARQEVAKDYRSIGWATIDDTPVSDHSEQLAIGHVWLGNSSVPFSKIRLHIQLATAGGAKQMLDLSSQLPSDGTGEAEFSFALPKDALTFQTLLSVPRGQDIFCVAQRFALMSNQTISSGPVKVSIAKEPRTCS
jgi:TIR domain